MIKSKAVSRYSRITLQQGFAGFMTGETVTVYRIANTGWIFESEDTTIKRFISDPYGFIYDYNVKPL